jgi:hypothetical protein
VQGNIVVELDNSEDLIVDLDVLKAERLLKTQKGRNLHVNRFGPEYLQRLKNCGLGSVIESIKKEQ